MIKAIVPSYILVIFPPLSNILEAKAPEWVFKVTCCLRWRK